MSKRKEYFPKVESYLGKYMKWKSRLEIIEAELYRLQPKVTPGYSDTPPSQTNMTSDTAGDMATKRADLQSEHAELSYKVWIIETALKALTEDQRKLFNIRYILDLKLNTSLDQLEIGKDQYYDMRNELVETVHEIVRDTIY